MTSSERKWVHFAGVAVLVGVLAGLGYGLYEGVRALVYQPATGIEQLRYFTRDYLLLIYLPPLAGLVLGGLLAFILSIVPAPLGGRRLFPLTMLMTAGAILLPWLGRIVPAGQPVFGLLRSRPGLFELLVALFISLAAGAAAGYGIRTVMRSGFLHSVWVFAVALWSGATLALFCFFIGPAGLGLGRWSWIAALLAASLLLFLIMTVSGLILIHRSRPWTAVIACGGLLAIQFALALGIAATLPRSQSSFVWPDAGINTGDTPNLILITVDTLRADHLSCYGHTERSTPVLDRFADRAVLIPRVTSNAPWTLPSMASLFTGRTPSACAMADGPARLPASIPTLAEILHHEGYTTQAIATNPWLKPNFGLHRGFAGHTHLEEGGVADHQFAAMMISRFFPSPKDRPKDSKDRIRADQVTGRALDWLAEVPVPSRPFFLWLHYMDPHEPYSPSPVPARDGYQGRFEASSGFTASIMSGPPLTSADLSRLKRLYDDEILAFDRELGKLLGLLRARALLDRSIVVITADHGDEFLEHGGLGHGQSLHDELLHVPLLIMLPEGRGCRTPWDTQVQLADLLPTLIGFCGMSSLPAGVQGRDLSGYLVSLADGGEPVPHPDPLAPAQALLSEAVRGGVQWKRLSWGPHQLLADRSSGTVYLYGTDSQSGEKTRLTDDSMAAETLFSLEQRLRELETENRRLAEAARVAGPGGEVEMTPEMRDQLKALGYLN